MRRLIVHVGPPKTGTSAIQHVLSTQETSFHYPDLGRWSDGSHHNLVFSICADARRQDAQLVARNLMLGMLRDRVEADERDVVISSEALYGGNFEKFLPPVREALSGLCGDVSVVLVAREHFAVASSLYNQHVKDAHYCETRSPDEFLQSRWRSLLHKPRIARFEALGCKVLVMNYHGGRLASRFLDALGGAEPAVDEPQRNTSLSVKTLIALLAINRKLGKDQRRSVLFDALKKTAHCFGRSRFIFDPLPCDGVGRAFQRDAEFLERAYGVRLPTPNLHNLKNEFLLSAQEYDELADVIRSCGHSDILAELSPFVCRHPSASSLEPTASARLDGT